MPLQLSEESSLVTVPGDFGIRVEGENAFLPTSLFQLCRTHGLPNLDLFLAFILITRLDYLTDLGWTAETQVDDALTIAKRNFIDQIDPHIFNTERRQFAFGARPPETI